MLWTDAPINEKVTGSNPRKIVSKIITYIDTANNNPVWHMHENKRHYVQQVKPEKDDKITESVIYNPDALRISRNKVPSSTGIPLPADKTME